MAAEGNNQNHVEEHLEKDFVRNDYPDEHLGAHTDTDHALNKIRTAGSISISPELFEKIYLSPKVCLFYVEKVPSRLTPC